ncbi:MAG: A24 family peptidase [Rhodobacteraceae bacterium]|nr:A24 family peptidase [Paracoccaceae bacterium]
MSNTVSSGAGLAGLFITSFLLANPWNTPVFVGFSLWLGVALIWLSVVDLRRFEIPDGAVWMLVSGGVAYHFQFGWPQAGQFVLEGSATFLLMFVFSVIANWWMQKTALGFGDVKLLGAVAIWVGLVGVSSAIFLASVAGILYALAMRALRGQAFGGAIPFGPFIALGVWTVWLFGPVL